MPRVIVQEEPEQVIPNTGQAEPPRTTTIWGDFFDLANEPQVVQSTEVILPSVRAGSPMTIHATGVSSLMIRDNINQVSWSDTPTHPTIPEGGGLLRDYLNRVDANLAGLSDGAEPSITTGNRASRARGRDRHPRQDTRGDDNRPESYQRPYWAIGYIDGIEFIVVRATNNYQTACDFMEDHRRHYPVVEFFDGTPGKMRAIWRGDFTRLAEQQAEGIKGYDGPLLSQRAARQALFNEMRQEDFRTVLFNRLQSSWGHVCDTWADENMDEEFATRFSLTLTDSMESLIRQFSEDIRTYQRDVIAPNID
jgi:hypothetical protein